MSERYATRFEEPGSLRTPGWIGRGVRLLLGTGLLDFAVSLARAELLARRGGGPLSSHPPASIEFWVLVVILFQILPHVVNIGFGVDWK